MPRAHKSSHKRSTNDRIQDFFGHDPLLEKVQQAKKVEQQPLFEGMRKVVIKMPDRGYKYSEQYRLACELNQLAAWYKSMTHTEWNELWEDIHRLRGEKAAELLSDQFEAYLYRDERDDGHNDGDGQEHPD